MDKIERDVIKNSEYILQYYKNNNKPLTNLELQKLVYFLEAIYMVSEDEDHLYNDNFYAWNFGPVNLALYNRYKMFGSSPIELENDVVINPKNIKYINNLFYLFHDFTPTQLVNLSHSKGSPWYKIYIKNNGDIPKNEIIKKIDTKEWFSSLVEKSNEK